MKLFDPKFYKSAYDDLKGLDVQSLKLHYLNYGHDENRLPSMNYFEQLYGVKKSNQTIKELVKIHTDYISKSNITLDPPGNKHMFDGKYYRETYPDVVAAGFNTSELALKHWLSYGQNEGRAPHAKKHLNVFDTKYKNWQITGDNLIVDTAKNKADHYGTHYFGWNGVMNGLYLNFSEQLVESKRYKHTIYFDPWLEKLTTWGKDRQNDYCTMNTIIDNDVKLITFTHNPPFEEWESTYKENTPETLNDLYNHINSNKNNFNGLLIQHTDHSLISNSIYYESCDSRLLDKCLYIYTVSREHKKYLTSPKIQKKYPYLKDKVLSINHPITDKIDTRFNFNLYKNSTSKKIYHIGWWMRNLKTFNDIKLPSCIEKTVLVKHDFNCFTDIIKPAMGNVNFASHLSNDEYIKVFEENILYMDPFDVTASNLLLECIRCETPVLLRRHPAFEQYIGYTYPMFFDTMSDIEQLTTTQFNTLVKKTHLYLKNLDKTHISQQTFNQKICYDLKKLEHSDKQTQLSWITSLYKADEYIDDLCNDFLNQNSRYPKELEWIIVNITGSHNEETEQKIINLNEQYPNINVINISKAQDPGIYKCWEIGIKSANGKYVTNANLDDRHDTNFSIKMIDYLENTPTVDITFAPVYTSDNYHQSFDDVNNKNNIWFTEYGIGQPLSTSDFWNKKTNESCNPCHSSPVWRRDIHDIVGYFEESIYGSIADWVLWLKCIDYNLNIAKCSNEPLAFYYINKSSYGRVKKIANKTQLIATRYNFSKDV